MSDILYHALCIQQKYLNHFRFSNCILYVTFNFYFLFKIYWSDTDLKNCIGFKSTVQWYVICTHGIVCHPKSNLVLSPCIWSPLPVITPILPPSSNCHTIVFVYEFFFVFFTCSFVIFSFISYRWVKLYGSWLLQSNWLHLA